MIVAGERRFRAFALLDRSTIPAIITEGGIDELALIENIQREDLSPIDEFEAVARLIKAHGYSQSDAARVLGKSRVSINELLSLGSLAADILEEARAAKVSKSALIEVARAGNLAAQRALWGSFRDGGGTVRAARKVKQEGANDADPPSPIGTALRAGRRFAKAVGDLPHEERFAEIRSATERLLSLLDGVA
jgi:ParB family chromosome partitioning protein